MSADLNKTLHDFTRTLGTAFFLIPSISTLAQLSEE